jgi:hypothetical protein
VIRNPPRPGTDEDPYDVAPSDTTVRRTVCPNCGSRRLGGFRYCRKCAYDFDGAERGAAMRRRSPAFQLDPWRDASGGSGEATRDQAASGADEPIVRVGAGRFTLTKRSFLVTAAAVGIAAAALVSLVALVLPH